MIWPNTLVFNAQWFFYGSHLASVPKRFQDKLQSGSRCFRLYLDIFRGWSFLSNSDIQRTSAVLLWLHLDVPTLCDKTTKDIRYKQWKNIYICIEFEKGFMLFRIWSLGWPNRFEVQFWWAKVNMSAFKLVVSSVYLGLLQH